MFGSIYGKTVELFGKALLVSAFLPLLAAGAALALSLSPSRALHIVGQWTAKEPSQQASAAILLLVSLYLLAFVIYGVRDGITRFLSSGRFWLLPQIRGWRRIHFTQIVLDKEDRFKGPGLAVAQAVTWAKGGFQTVDPQLVYTPRGAKPERFAREAGIILKRMERRRRKTQQRISAQQRAELARLFLALHRLARLDGTRGASCVQRLQKFCNTHQPPIDLQAWCEDVKALDFGGIVEAYDEGVWSPPLREIQPTALGNVLIWAYSYTRQRYGIELDFLYPRLQKVIDKDFQSKIDDRQQFLDFSVILTFLTFLGAIAYACTATLSIVANPDKHAWQPIAGAATVLVGWLIFGRLAYGLCLAAAHGYVAIITSAVDLFRMPLHKEPQDEPPNEQEVWKRLNKRILTGKTEPAPPHPKGIYARIQRLIRR